MSSKPSNPWVHADCTAITVLFILELDANFAESVVRATVNDWHCICVSLMKTTHECKQFEALDLARKHIKVVYERALAGSATSLLKKSMVAAWRDLLERSKQYEHMAEGVAEDDEEDAEEDAEENVMVCAGQNCGKVEMEDGEALMRCSRCQKTLYCFVECQKRQVSLATELASLRSSDAAGHWLTRFFLLP